MVVNSLARGLSSFALISSGRASERAISAIARVCLALWMSAFREAKLFSKLIVAVALSELLEDEACPVLCSPRQDGRANVPPRNLAISCTPTRSDDDRHLRDLVRIGDLPSEAFNHAVRSTIQQSGLPQCLESC